jgi:rare lipoprotein A
LKKTLKLVAIAICMLAVAQITHATISGYNVQTAVVTKTTVTSNPVTKYLSVKTIAIAPTVATNTVGTVTASPALNLRESAGTTSVILSSIPKDTQVTVNSKNESNWYNVTYNDQTGWVSGSFLTVISSQSTQTQPPEPPQTTQAQPTQLQLTQAQPTQTKATQVSRSMPAQKAEHRMMRVTAYSLLDDQSMNKGITASGEKVLEGRTIAADPSIPFGTQIYIPELGETFTVTDRGGAIKGDRLDIYMKGQKDALKFGSRELEIQIIH